MKKLEEIKELYHRVIEAKGKTGNNGEITLGFALSKQLLSTNDLEILNFQYECLRDTSNYTAYTTCRAAFFERSISIIKPFLFEKLSIEKDVHVVGDIIFILGGMRILESIDIAKEYIKNIDSHIRYSCIIVLGWVGNPQEIELLAQHIKIEKDPKLRGYCATAMRQIFFRLPETKEAIFFYLKDTILQEENEEALKLMIISIQSVSRKYFGLRENINEDTVTGDIQIAKTKALKYLSKLN